MLLVPVDGRLSTQGVEHAPRLVAFEDVEVGEVYLVEGDGGWCMRGSLGDPVARNFVWIRT